MLVGKGSHAQRRSHLQNHVRNNAADIYDEAVKSIKADLTRSKRKIKRELEKTAKRSANSVGRTVSFCVEGILGKASNPKTLDAKFRMKGILEEWHSDWQYPEPEEKHVLQLDLGIPEQLRKADVRAMQRVLNEKHGIDLGSEGDEEDVKVEADIKSESSDEEG